MTTAYTSLLGLALPVTGELSGTWGDTVNNSITSLLDTSVAGTTNVSADSNVTLTTTTGASNQARQAILLFSGARTAIRTVTAPAQSKIYTVINATTGGFAVTLVGAGPTTGVTIVAGESAVCAWNGSDFVKVSNTGGSGTFTNLTVTGVATFSAGSASTPSLTTAGDTNTGMFFPAADTIAFAEGGAEIARFDSSGNLGLGVTPSAWGTITALQVKNAFVGGLTNNAYFGANAYYNGTNYIYQASSFASLYFQSSSAHQWFNAPSGTAGNAITFTQAMTLTAGGNLGVGNTSPDSRLVVEGSSGTYAQIKDGTVNTFIQARSADSVGVVGTITNHGLAFYTNSTEKARIDSSGNLLIGKTSSDNNVQGACIVGSTGQVVSTLAGSTNSTNSWTLYSTGASAYRFYVGMGGTINATSTTITGISDQRLKENIRELDDGLEKVMALQPRKFDWKEGKGANIKNARGFIAQEFETVFPDMIEEWLDPAPEGEEPYKAVNANLIPTLVKAIQEQQALIETLTQRIATLEAK
jgi:hypothetical protein